MKTVRLTLCQYILAQGGKGCTVAEVADGTGRDWHPTRQALNVLVKDGFLDATPYTRRSGKDAPQQKRFTCSKAQVSKLIAAEKAIHEMRKTPGFVANHTPAPDLASVMHGFVRCAL